MTPETLGGIAGVVIVANYLAEAISEMSGSGTRRAAGCKTAGASSLPGRRDRLDCHVKK
jgi:hypothetical protein